MKQLFFSLAIVISTSSNAQNSQNTTAIKNTIPAKIQVLNLGTFHMGETSDANKIEFDENNKKAQQEVHAIAQKIAAFKPTVIIVETPPSFDEKLQAEYLQYLQTPSMKFKTPSEIELLAYEVGRLAGTKRIYGIDHKMEYDYTIGSKLNNAVDSVVYNNFYKNIFAFAPVEYKHLDKMSVLEKLKTLNKNIFLNFAIAVNADMLAHAGTAEGFEGADEAAKYYQRNLRMYCNLNRIKIEPKDKVFILLGSSHTAFFRDFFSRSPKYKMINSFEYLK
jgi:hypothetical protein